MKPIRLIELFAGVGSQASALDRLGVNYQPWKISEWEVNATASYKAIHTNDNNDYAVGLSASDLTHILFTWGISTDGKTPMTLEQIQKKSYEWKRTVYNNFKATNNLGSITKQTDRQTDRQTVDLSINKPKQIDIANCIIARYDSGIRHRQSEGTGVLERETDI